MRSSICMTILILCGLCVFCAAMGPKKKGTIKAAGKANVVTVFLTGNEFGTMKPCGCSGGQLGGFSRRSAVFKKVAKAKRLILDAGRLVDGDGAQDQIKFNVIIRALGLLGYDAVNISGRDLEIAQNLGLLGNMGSDLHVVGAGGPPDANIPASFTKRIPVKGGTLAVTVGVFDVRTGRAEQIERLFAAVPDAEAVNILILNGCGVDMVDSFVKKIGGVDCVICADGSDKPMVIGDPDRRPLVFSVGQLGKYVAKLEITPKTAKEPLKLAFSAVPVSEDLPESEDLAQLYEEYQVIVKAMGLLENQARAALPGGEKYMGSKSCAECHEYAYEKWSTKRHAHAYATLEEVGSDYDPQCVVCHVVGMRYESGFVVPDSTPELKDVGCENCHGPGSAHAASEGEEPLGEPKSDCETCHTPYNSVNYGGNEAEYFEKIVHWREPKSASSVKRYRKTGGSTDL